MGFFDTLGSVLGEITAKATAKAQIIQQYKAEYINFTNEQLKDELERLNSRCGSNANERRMAVASLLKDRGAI